jgi:hypothetical protein
MEKQIKLDLSKATFPLKTLNGSSFDQMKDALAELHIAIGKAKEQLRSCAPHPRDYPVEGTYQKAIAQHDQHYGLLNDLEDFYIDKAISCFNQSKP